MLVALLVWAAIVIVSMLVVSWLAVRWGRDPFGWALLAAVIGPIALVGLFGSRQSDRQRPVPFEGTRPAGRATGPAPVLVGVDGSPQSVRAARYVAGTHARGGEVVLLAVFPHEAQPGDDAAAREAHEQTVSRMTDEALQVLRGAGMRPRVVVGYGNPAEELIRCAREENADLIVVGRRGAGLSRAVLGSVSGHVVSHADRNVAVVE